MNGSCIRRCALVAAMLFGLVASGTASGLTIYDVDNAVSIPDPGEVFTTFTVAGEGSIIVDVNVRIAIDHPLVEDLDVMLMSPAGTTVELFSDLLIGDFSAMHFQDTLLDDGAAVAITAGSAPFIGSYRPEGSLADFNGENPNGVWTLFVEDDQLLPFGDQTVLAAGDTAPWGDAVGTQLMIEARDPSRVIPEPIAATLSLMGLSALGVHVRRRRI
ncbi:MAG: hypothetical protein CMJ18_17230 [Phycisphaeraceae bacterium]|nr:hypothetical protein [Phycisphaeraceae bacterium]